MRVPPGTDGGNQMRAIPITTRTIEPAFYSFLPGDVVRQRCVMPAESGYHTGVVVCEAQVEATV